MKNEIRLGIDLGGTKTEVAAIEPTGQVIFRHREFTPKGDYQATIALIARLVQQAEHALKVNHLTVGVGIPGAISSMTGLVKNANSTWLIGQDLKTDLQKTLKREVKIENDANCFVLSEALYGAAIGEPSVFGVIIGTGCGGGLVVNGKVIAGANAIAGEWGHNPLPWISSNEQNLACYCGKVNCVETFLSGTGLQKRFKLQYHQDWDVQELVKNMRCGNEYAIKMMDQYYDWLAKGLASVINVFDPHAIVLGGGLSQIDELYHQIPRRWGQWVFSDQVVTKLCAPKLGDSSGVIGAAGLWG